MTVWSNNIILIKCKVNTKSEENYLKKKSGNGGGYLSYRCAGGRGNTALTPEAGEVRLQSPDSLGKEHVLL